jgi:peptide/nickel transport system permease protein
LIKLRIVVVHLFSILLLMWIAALPLVFFSMNNQTVFEPLRAITLMKNFFLGLFTGESFYYSAGSNTRLLTSDIISYFVSSYLYLACSGVIVLILSFFLGIWFWKKSEKWLNDLLNFIGMVPDFIFILLLQIFFTEIYKNTGIRLVKVASISTDDPAIFLPLLSLMILPLNYLVRSLNDRTKEVISEDYILTAISKGLNKRQIYLYHVTSNVIPYLKADIYKITAIMISNLFIVEYLFNTRGITAILFQLQKFGYQYNVVVISLLAIFILYLCVFFTLKLIIKAIERILAYE